MQRPLARALGAVLIVIAAAIPAGAQDKPRSGGELVFVVPSESRGRSPRTASPIHSSCVRA